jgi:ribonucleoside-triphosphate reductase
MFFSTIGMIGIFEAFELLGTNLLEDQDKVKGFLTTCNDKLVELSKVFKIPLNLEQIPGEGAAVNFAKKDRVYFGDNKYVLYSNQFIPLWVDCDLVKRAEIDGELLSYFGGGVISHLNILSKTSKEQMLKLISFATKCGLSHFALNLCFAKCTNEHVTTTTSKICPICNSKIVDHFTRIVGYLTPVSSWLKERREYEFERRQFKKLELK